MFFNFRFRAALLIKLQDFDLQPGRIVDLPQHIVRCAEDAVKELKLVGQKLINPLVRRIAFIQKIDDHHVMFLSVAMATANALFDTLRIPGQIIVDHQRTEL